MCYIVKRRQKSIQHVISKRGTSEKTYTLGITAMCDRSVCCLSFLSVSQRIAMTFFLLKSKNLFDFLLFNQLFQRIQMLFKSFFSIFCSFVIGIWLTAQKGFVHNNIFLFLQSFEVLCQVTVSYFQQFFQRIKIIALVYHKHAHNL